MLRPDTFALTVLLALLTAAAPISVDMYLPSLPEIGRTLGASVPQVQLTLSVFLFGFAFSQIVYGPISDHVGRKPVLVAALSVYTAASLGCALAPSIEMLIVLRVVQALGVAGAPVLARAIVRDLYEGARAGRELSLMGSIMAFAPVLAPAAGGVLQATVGWQANFVVQALFGMLVLLVVLRLMPETMHRATPGGLSLGSIVRGYATFFRHRDFLIYVAIAAAGYGGLFAWISGSSFALQDIYGFSALMFGLAFAVTGLGYLTGTLLAAKLVIRISLDRTIVCGAAAMCAGGVIMTAAVALDLHNPFALIVPAALYIVGLGLTMPQAMAGALTPFPERAGSASSLLGFVQQVVASSAGILVGLLLGKTALPLAAIIATMGTVALALALLNRSLRRAS
jgi:DHA1 family bicyclomycin/chloramphenicol resistance-like MFS transporter